MTTSLHELFAIDDTLLPSTDSRDRAATRLDALIAAESGRPDGLPPRWPLPRSRRALLISFATIAVLASAAAALSVAFNLPDLLLAHGIAAPGSTPVVLAQETVDGRTWSIVTYVRPNGETCIAQSPGVSTECPFDPQHVLARSPLFTQTSALREPPTSAHWTDIRIWGIVDTRRITHLDLQLSSCKRIPIQPGADGVFQTVVDTSTLATGVVPTTVLAYDPHGNLVTTRNLAIFPGSDSDSSPPKNCG